MSAPIKRQYFRMVEALNRMLWAKRYEELVKQHEKKVRAKAAGVAE
jgi:hypothetical protein